MRVFAAIDCGSNSFHLMVVRVDEDQQAWEVIAKDKEVLRLADTDSGKISTLALERALEVLARFRKTAENLGAERIVAVATSAIREARNGDTFLERADLEAGVPVSLISGAEEARLIYLGVASAYNFGGRKIAIVDVGGGSTELIVGTADALLLNRSVRLGAVDLTAQFHDADPISPDGYQELLLHVHHTLLPITKEMRAIGFDALVGTSGTIANLAAIDAARGAGGDPKAGYVLSHKAVREIERSLRGMNYDERLEVPGMSARRADIAVAGARVVRTVMDQLDVEELTTCDRALREGMILDLLYREGVLEAGTAGHDQVRRRAVRDMAERFRCDLAHGEHVTKLALAIFDQLGALHGIAAGYRDVLEGAAMLHEVGLCVSRDAYHRHSHYLIRHSEFLGFHDDEIRLMANLARYHRKGLPKKKHDNYMEMSFDHRMVARRLIAILRMARALAKSRTDVVRDLTLEVRANCVKFVLHVAGDCDLELRAAHAKAEIYAKYLGVDVQFEVAPLPAGEAASVAEAAS